VNLCSRVLDEIHLTLRRELSALPRATRPVNLLDVGCWDGLGTLRYAESLGGARAHGIEVFEAQAVEAERRGIEVARVDLEADVFPWPDASMDVVVCNQVLEHLKNIWQPLAEMHRVLRPGGYALLSVPNLASLHNRVLLATGRQPTSIRTFGPHVRGYAFGEFRALVERDGAFRVMRALGVGFHPVPAPWGAPLARLWPGAAHSTLLVARRGEGRAPWLGYLTGELEGGLQTFYRA
jgi:methionine biosynthesis protein MetW